MQWRVLHNERGFATLIALLMIGMLTLLGIAALSTSDDEVNIAGNELQETRAFYAAEAGLDMAAAALQTEYDSTGVPPLLLPTGTESVNNCLVKFGTADDGPAQQEVLSTGSLVGLHALVKSFTISSTAVGGSIGAGRVDMAQTFETALVPIFQWAVFFNEDMWAQPAYAMNIDGRVHVNKDMHLQSTGTALTFEDRVTCGGDIYAGFGYSHGTGDVRFTNRADTAVSMKQGGTWIDADRADWYDTASYLWQGMVQDKSFGQQQLQLPLTNAGDPRKMIERGSGNSDSYEHQAGLKIIDGVPMAKDMSGVWQDVSASLPAGTITGGTGVGFYDAHEKKWVRNTQIDVDKLESSGYFPKNGIIYVSDQRDTDTEDYGTVLNAAMLVNGDDLGAPMTVACENPMYVQGDFNVNKNQPAAALADAITFLSNNWDRTKATPSNKYTDRKTRATEANICFITGDLAPAGTNYGGGLENLPRFLEDWRSTEFKWRGSMVEMWRSEQATGTWRYPPTSNAYYTAPTRNWGYDTDLDDPNKLPPGTPCVRVFQRIGWKQEHVGAYQESGDH